MRIPPHAVGVPVVITSGTRCRRHNAAVGGVYNSLHLTGSAADISIPALSLDTCCLATLGRYVARLHAIDEHARVLDFTGKPMQGLYACGEIAGGIIAHNVPGGTGLIKSTVTALLAGRHAAGVSA